MSNEVAFLQLFAAQTQETPTQIGSNVVMPVALLIAVATAVFMYGKYTQRIDSLNKENADLRREAEVGNTHNKNIFEKDVQRLEQSIAESKNKQAQMQVQIDRFSTEIATIQTNYAKVSNDVEWTRKSVDRVEKTIGDMEKKLDNLLARLPTK